MVNTNLIKKQLLNPTISTDFKNLGKKLNGKVRDVYEKNNQMIFITTDRQSGFDRHLTYVPFKGQILTQTSNFWFKNTEDIVKNHYISSPVPNVTIGKKLKVFEIEFVIRGYLTGMTSTAVWTAYSKGEREFCGNILPEGMKKNQPFKEPIITPTTKGITDEKITPTEILKQGYMTKEQWEKAKDICLKLFKRGQEIAAKNNLILVDTKYELGIDEMGEIHLCDEIHTPDSSRFWIANTYEERFNNEEAPESVDKDFIRIWIKNNVKDPYKDTIPEIPQEMIVKLSEKYITLYEMITGKKFDYVTCNNEIIEETLKDKGFLN